MIASLQNKSARWRTLSVAELAVEPQAGMGGALAVIFVGAATLPALLIAALVWFVAAGDPFVIAGLGNMIFADHGLASVMARINLVPQAMVFVWGIVFTLMTLRRSPSTPRVASVLFALWAVFAIGAAIGARFVMNGHQVDWASQAMLIPTPAFDAAVAAAFWGYMHDGLRPNLYYRRRMRS